MFQTIEEKFIGKSPFPEENVTSVNPAEKYTIVETNIKGYSTMGKNCIYLLDNMTLKYQKIDEYSSNEDKNYNQFDGKCYSFL